MSHKLGINDNLLPRTASQSIPQTIFSFFRSFSIDKKVWKKEPE